MAGPRERFARKWSPTDCFISVGLCFFCASAEMPHLILDVPFRRVHGFLQCLFGESTTFRRTAFFVRTAWACLKLVLFSFFTSTEHCVKIAMMLNHPFTDCFHLSIDEHSVRSSTVCTVSNAGQLVCTLRLRLLFSLDRVGVCLPLELHEVINSRGSGKDLAAFAQERSGTCCCLIINVSGNLKTSCKRSSVLRFLRGVAPSRLLRGM